MVPETEYIELYELQRLLKQGVASLFPDALWVKAEIASLGVRTNGHCYLELSQSGPSGVIAKVRGAIWRHNWPFISQYFKAVTGEELKAGVEVLVRVRVSYHELYGMALTIDEINPEFTVGARELRRKLTLERLEREGLLDLQKELCLPELPYRLAVISAPDAAGFGDFRRHLLENEYGYAYAVDLFEATMQGQGAPVSICAALAAVAEASVPYDAVLILRGGGSELDLECFDDYDLAAAIARFPIPVFTAIGHDRDHHVADEVAHLSVKTPTALADLFLECSAAEDERISALEMRLQRAFTGRLHGQELRLDQTASRIAHGAAGRLHQAESAVEYWQKVLGRAAAGRIRQAEEAVDNWQKTLGRAATGRVLRAADRLDGKETFIRQMALHVLEKADIRLTALEQHILSADPRRVLERGIPVVENARGRRDSRARDYRPGDAVRVFLPDGKLDCLVREVSLTGPDIKTQTA